MPFSQRKRRKGLVLESPEMGFEPFKGILHEQTGVFPSETQSSRSGIPFIVGRWLRQPQIIIDVIICHKDSDSGRFRLAEAFISHYHSEASDQRNLIQQLSGLLAVVNINELESIRAKRFALEFLKSRTPLMLVNRIGAPCSEVKAFDERSSDPLCS
jgi:uncharacterized protein (DUF927 family)